jgi:hypothetical protein
MATLARSFAMPYTCAKCKCRFSTVPDVANNATTCPNCLELLGSADDATSTSVSADAHPLSQLSPGLHSDIQLPTPSQDIALHPLARWRIVLGIWIAITALLCVVAWVYSGQKSVEEKLFPALAILGFALVVRSIWKIWHYKPAREWAAGALAIPLLVVTYAACALIVSFFPQSRVFLDNASGQDLDVYCDGHLWVACAPGSQLQLMLRCGDHELSAVDAATGIEMDRRKIKILPAARPMTPVVYAAEHKSAS